jgi:hypothetical protein
MADEQPELHDDTFYAPLFEPITSKLQATGGMEFEIFIGELFPLVQAHFDGDDVYEAIRRLAARGIIRWEDSDGEAFIELVEC